MSEVDKTVCNMLSTISAPAVKFRLKKYQPVYSLEIST